jgi:hypothetical protein
MEIGKRSIAVGTSPERNGSSPATEDGGVCGKFQYRG